jgi:hypothetical protein
MSKETFAGGFAISGGLVGINFAKDIIESKANLSIFIEFGTIGVLMFIGGALGWLIGEGIYSLVNN